MNIIKLLLSSVFLITGCVKNNASRIPDTDKTKINIEIVNNFSQTATPNDNQALFIGEYKINTIRVITFDGEFLDKNMHMPIINNIGGSIKLEMDVSNINNKYIYVLVNEPKNSTQDLGKLRSRDDLKTFKYSIASYFTSDTGAAFSYDKWQETDLGFSGLPMSGAITIDPVAGRNYPITLHRTLARVDVWLRGEKNGFLLKESTNIDSGSALVYNTSKKGNFFDKNIYEIPTPTLVTKEVAAKSITIHSKETAVDIDKLGAIGNYSRIFTFYTPERTSSNDDSRLKFTITGVLYNGLKINSSEVVLIEDLNGAVDVIKRNNVYSVYCTITGTGELSLNYEVSPWETIGINIPTFE